MAAGSGNDFADVTEEIIVEEFELWTVETLR